MNFTFEKERMTARTDDGILIGSITFPRVRAGLVNINQTLIVPPFRGQGMEEAMIGALLAHLTKLNQKVALTCPYVQQYVQKNPRWNHILPGKMHFTAH